MQGRILDFGIGKMGNFGIRNTELRYAGSISVFEVKGEYNHAGEDLPQVIGIFEAGIYLVQVGDAVADLYFGRKRYKGQVKIKAQPQLKSHIISFELDHILHIP